MTLIPAGRAITEAMQAQQRRDFVATWWHLILLHNTLKAFHWWGWDWRASRVWMDHKPRIVVHGFSCSSPRFDEPCTCRLPRVP